MKHEQSCFKSSARPMLDPDKVDNTDVNADVITDLPENFTLGLEILAIGCAAVSAGCRYSGSSSHGGNIRLTAGEFAGPCAGPGQWICERSTSSKPPLEQVALGVNRRSDNLDSSDEPQFGSDSSGQTVQSGIGGSHPT